MSGGTKTAAGAHDRIEAHEALCAERYANIHGRIDAVAADVREGRNLTRAAVVGLLGWLALQVYQGLAEGKAHAAPPAAVVSSGTN